MAAKQGNQMTIDDRPFQKMVKKMIADFGPQPEAVEKIVNVLAMKVLARTANDVGVAQPKGKFSKKMSVGKSHIRRRYTWNRPTGRGKNAGKQPNQYAHVARAIKVNGRKFTINKFEHYSRNGAVTQVESRLAEIRKRAMARVGSGKAAFYHLAKTAKLTGATTRDFKDRGDLEDALKSCGMTYTAASRSSKVARGAEYTLKFTSSAHNALNPSVRGKKVFQTKVNGMKREFGVLVRKGYIKSLDDIAEQYGANVVGP
jgi:hypothetical protein